VEKFDENENVSKYEKKRFLIHGHRRVADDVFDDDDGDDDMEVVEDVSTADHAEEEEDGVSSRRERSPCPRRTLLRSPLSSSPL